MQNCTIKTKGLIGKMGLEEQKEKKSVTYKKKTDKKGNTVLYTLMAKKYVNTIINISLYLEMT